jgi:hypothetical protein
VKEVERVFVEFPKYHMKILLGDFKAGKTFLNRQLGTKVCTKLVMIMELGQ